MGVEIIKEIDVDFYENKLIYVKAKQGDIGRYLLVHCYNQGNRVRFSSKFVTAFIRGKKYDGFNFMNTCVVTCDGDILIELNSQMLASYGNINADLLLYTYKRGLFSTMNFIINVIPSSFPDDELLSSPEYTALKDLLDKVNAPADEVIEEVKGYALDAAGYWEKSEENSLLSKSYAIGGTSTRENEDTDNAKYYSELAKSAANSQFAASLDEAKIFLDIP